jgi:nitroreductase
MIDGEKMLELIKCRQSHRKYSNRPVEPEKLERIIEAGRMAPSACNAQPWKLIVVTDPELTQRIAQATSSKVLGINTFVFQAPVQIIIVREKPNLTSKLGSAIKEKDFSLMDIGIVSENICLQAEAEELGSCMIGWFDEKMVRKLLGIPRFKRVELIITLGYSLSDKRERKRKPASETVSYNKY